MGKNEFSHFLSHHAHLPCNCQVSRAVHRQAHLQKKIRGGFELKSIAPFVIFIIGVTSLTFVLMVVAHRTTLGHGNVFVYVIVSSLLGAVKVVRAKELSTLVKPTMLVNFQFGS